METHRTISLNQLKTNKMTELTTLEDVLKSKVYVNEKGGVNFHSPRQYIEPFLNKFKNISGAQYDVKVSGSVMNKEEDETVNIAYSRIGVKVTLPEQYRSNEHNSVIGMVYALDVTKPIMKVFSGEDADFCTNLAIFGAQYFHSVEILAGTANIYERAGLYLEGVEKQLAEFQKVYERLNDTMYKGEDEINRIMGHILRKSYENKYIGTNCVLSALKDLENNKSRYAIKDNETSAWNIYSAMTQYVTDKVDIAEKPVKTVMISNLFHNGF